MRNTPPVFSNQFELNLIGNEHWLWYGIIALAIIIVGVYASRQKSTSAVSENSNPDGRVSRDEKRSGEESLVLVNAGRGEEPLILKQLTPTVAGVVVLCSGADDVNVRQQIINVVTTALGTSSNRVCVTRLA